MKQHKEVQEEHLQSTGQRGRGARLTEVLLPATTALGTLQQDGRLLGVLAGANVIMPNLTPQSVQENYNLYNNKLHTDSAISVAIAQLQSSLASIGYSIAVGRGDFGE